MGLLRFFGAARTVVVDDPEQAAFRVDPALMADKDEYIAEVRRQVAARRLLARGGADGV